MRISVVILALLWSAPAAAFTVKHTSTGAPVRWGVDTIAVRVHSSMEAVAPLPEVLAAARVACDAWTGWSGPELSLDPTVDQAPYAPGARGIQIVALDPWPYAPHLLAVTATTYDDANGRILDADILVNPGHPFMLQNEAAPDHARYDLGALLAHEMGHALGLDESEADPMATMWPTIGRGEVHQRTIEADDVEGIEEAYRGAVLVSPAGCGRASVARSGDAGWLALIFALAALTIRRAP